VRTYIVEVPSPVLNDDLGFAAVAKPLDVETFIAKFAIERLIGAILPGLAGIDEGRIDAIVQQPFENGVAYELWAVVRPQDGGCAMHANQSCQYLDDSRRANATGNVDRQALMSKFVNHRQAFELLPGGTGIEE